VRPVFENRSCTDIFCLIIFVLFWGGMVAVAYLGYRDGDLWRLYYGTDFQGSTCSIDSSTVPTNLTGASWAKRKNIWYPITVDMVQTLATDAASLLTDPFSIADGLGVCVEECPQPSANLLTPAMQQSYSDPVIEWPVLYASKPILNRCFPDLASNLTLKELTNFVQVANADSWSSFWDSVVSSVVAGLPVLGLATGGVAVVCFVLMFLFRWIVGVILYTLVFLVDALIFAGGGVLIWYGIHQSATAPAEDPVHDWITAIYIAAGILFFIGIIYTLVLIFMFRRIRIAVAVLELASKVIVSAPTVVLVPPCTLIFFFAALAWGLAVEGLLYTAGHITIQNITVTVPDPILGTNTSIAIPSALLNSEYTSIFMQLYNLFGTLWTLAMVHAIAFMTIAFVASMYYFSDPQPGNNKSVPCGGVLISLGWTLFYHLGTLAFGSFVLACVQLIRLLAAYVQSKIEKTQSDAAKWVGRCVQCYLACLERVVNFVNRNAYVVTCIQSSGFCKSCYTAMDLLLSCLAEVATANFLADWVFVCCKLAITGGWTFLCWWLLENTELGDGVDLPIVLTVLVGIISYLVASLFFHVYDAVQDAVLMCYCYDKEKNNGTPEKPYYFNDDLAGILDKYNQKVVPVDGEQNEDMGDMAGQRAYKSSRPNEAGMTDMNVSLQAPSSIAGANGTFTSLEEEPNTRALTMKHAPIPESPEHSMDESPELVWDSAFHQHNLPKPVDPMMYVTG